MSTTFYVRERERYDILLLLHLCQLMAIVLLSLVIVNEDSLEQDFGKSIYVNNLHVS